MNSFRKAKVFVDDIFAGSLEENETGFRFTYDENYLSKENIKPVSLTMPIRKESYNSEILFPFFDGLIPEGFLLNIVKNNWKLDINDRFGLLLVSGKDPIGNVKVTEEL